MYKLNHKTFNKDLILFMDFALETGPNAQWFQPAFGFKCSLSIRKLPFNDSEMQTIQNSDIRDGIGRKNVGSFIERPQHPLQRLTNSCGSNLPAST
jgi:hypothetical protein